MNMTTTPAGNIEPPPPAIANGKGQLPPTSPPATLADGPIVQAKPDPAMTVKLKRLAAIEKAGAAVRALELRVAKQETAVSAAKSELEDEREALSELNRELTDLQEDLTKISTGGFSERFNFPDPSKAVKKTITTASTSTAAKPPTSWEDAAQAAFDGSTLKVLGITGALADKLDADGIRDGKALRLFMQAVPRKSIAGVGDAAMSKLQDLSADFYVKYEQANPRQAAALTFPELQKKLRGEANVWPVSLSALATPLRTLAGVVHQHLLTPMQNGKTPEISAVVTVLGLKSMPYLCVPAAAGDPKDTYRLLPLYADGTQPTEPRKADEAGAYFAKRVTHGGKTFVIGAKADGLLICDGVQVRADLRDDQQKGAAALSAAVGSTAKVPKGAGKSKVAAKGKKTAKKK